MIAHSTSSPVHRREATLWEKLEARRAEEVVLVEMWGDLLDAGRETEARQLEPRMALAARRVMWAQRRFDAVVDRLVELNGSLAPHAVALRIKAYGGSAIQF